MKTLELQQTPSGGSDHRLVRRPRVKRGEYWVFQLLSADGKPVGNTWGGIYEKSFEMPATLAFKDRAPGNFESAEHGVAIYRQPNIKTVATCATGDTNEGENKR